MKQIIFLASLVITFACNGQSNTASLKSALINITETETPLELLTDADTCWTIASIEDVGYIKTTECKNYNGYENGSRMIVKFRFLKEKRFEFLLYVQDNALERGTETWTHIYGTTSFYTNDNGERVFTTNAKKGLHRVIKNGAVTTRAISENDLKSRHSNTFMWERTRLPNDRDNDYLLMLNLDEHPGVNTSEPGTIDPSWLAKFRIPNKK